MPEHVPVPVSIDDDYLQSVLRSLLSIPSPSGYTDAVVHHVGEELEKLGLKYELTRRGAIRATIPGHKQAPKRAFVAHVDTLGAMVTELKDNGRLAIGQIGTWSARFAEGARVTVFCDRQVVYRGTILPLKASGHVYNEEIDTQPVAWSNLEVRLDQKIFDAEQLWVAGVRVGDYVAIDPQPEFTPEGFIVSRHLDNKAGVACLLAATKAVLDQNVKLPIDCYLLFTIFEEVGSGASAVLHQDVAEMVSIDNATPAPGQSSTEYDVTIAMLDSFGPFDYHLTRRLLRLAKEYEISHCRDVFRYYRCDAASAVEAGNDIRTALVCFGVDGSHGYERTHIDSLTSLARLIGVYMQSEPAVARDRMRMGPIAGFPDQPVEAPPVPAKGEVQEESTKGDE